MTIDTTSIAVAIASGADTVSAIARELGVPPDSQQLRDMLAGMIGSGFLVTDDGARRLALADPDPYGDSVMRHHRTAAGPDRPTIPRYAEGGDPAGTWSAGPPDGVRVETPDGTEVRYPHHTILPGGGRWVHPPVHVKDIPTDEGQKIGTRVHLADIRPGERFVTDDETPDGRARVMVVDDPANGGVGAVGWATFHPHGSTSGQDDSDALPGSRYVYQVDTPPHFAAGYIDGYQTQNHAGAEGFGYNADLFTDPGYSAGLARGRSEALDDELSKEAFIGTLAPHLQPGYTGPAGVSPTESADRARGVLDQMTTGYAGLSAAAAQAGQADLADTYHHLSTSAAEAARSYRPDHP